VNLQSRVKKLETARLDDGPRLPMVIVDLGDADPYGSGQPYTMPAATLPALLKVYGQDED
jgi:hypothetical protein